VFSQLVHIPSSVGTVMFSQLVHIPSSVGTVMDNFRIVSLFYIQRFAVRSFLNKIVILIFQGGGGNFDVSGFILVWFELK